VVLYTLSKTQKYESLDFEESPSTDQALLRVNSPLSISIHEVTNSEILTIFMDIIHYPFLNYNMYTGDPGTTTIGNFILSAISFFLLGCVLGTLLFFDLELPSQSGKLLTPSPWDRKQKKKKEARLASEALRRKMNFQLANVDYVRKNKRVHKKVTFESQSGFIMNLCLRSRVVFLTDGTKSNQLYFPSVDTEPLFESQSGLQNGPSTFFTLMTYIFVHFCQWILSLFERYNNWLASIDAELTVCDKGALLTPMQIWTNAQEALPSPQDYSLIEWFWETFDGVVIYFEEVLSKPYFTDFQTYLSIYGHLEKFVTCELFLSTMKMFDILTTLEWLEPHEYEWRGLKVFKTKKLREEVTLMCFLRTLTSVIRCFMLGCVRFARTFKFSSFYEDVLLASYEDDYTTVVAMKPLVEIGRMPDNFDDLKFDRMLDEVTAKTSELLAANPEKGRSYYTPKLKELKMIKTQRLLAQRSSIRMAPYGILFYGGSSVGKSSIAYPVARTVAGMNGFDTDPKSVITLNDADQFQSEYRTHHTTVVFDDLMNGKLKFAKSIPTDKIIQFINNIPMTALNPNLELKGNVFIMPRIVIGTTNVKHLNAATVSEEPVSILRRFKVVVTQTVKPEFCKVGSLMLDPDKIENVNGFIPDYALFTCQYADLEKGSTKNGAVAFYNISYKNKELVDIDINELLDFLEFDSANHFRQQRNLVKNYEDNAELVMCKHHRPQGNCLKCAQPSDDDLSELITEIEPELECIPVAVANAGLDLPTWAVESDTKPYCSFVDPKVAALAEEPDPPSQSADEPKRPTYSVPNYSGMPGLMEPNADYESDSDDDEINMPSLLSRPPDDDDSDDEDDVVTVFESQFAGFDFAIFYAFEESMCLYMEGRLRALFNTKFGVAIIAFHNRHFIAEIINSVKTPLVCLLAFGLYNEFIVGVPMLMHFLFGIICFALYVMLRLKLKQRAFIKKYSTIPRPSVYFASLSIAKKLQFASFIGGLATVTAISKFLTKKTMPTSNSQAAPCIVVKPDALPTDKKTEFWDTRSLEKSVRYNPLMEPKAKTTTFAQLVKIVSSRQYLLHLKSEKGMTLHCDAVPLRSNCILIPNHIVPKVTTPAELIKQGASTKNVVLSPEACYHIPHTDYAIWYLPELGDQKDITKYFPSFISRNKLIEGVLIFNDLGKIIQYPRMNFRRTKTVSSLGGTFESLEYSLPGGTFNGLCMATIVAEDAKGAPFIPGFHLAGYNSTGAGGFITKDQILAGLEEINKKPGFMASHSATTFDTHLCGIEIGPLVTPHELCVSHDLPTTAKCEVIGQHNQPRGSPKSNVVSTCISDSVEEIMNIPVQHGKPYKMADRIHKEVDIANKTDTAYNFNGESFENAYKDLSRKLKKAFPKEKLKGKVGPISWDHVLGGMDGVQGANPMEFKTAAGVPFRGTKEQFIELSEKFVELQSCPRDCDHIIIDECDRIILVLKSGKRINTPFKASLKDEPVKCGKKKVRVFAGCNMAFTMVVRKYYLLLSKLMQDNKLDFECAVGIDVASPEWTVIMDHVYQHGIDRVVAGDYKAFDGRMSPKFMLAAFKLLIELAEESGQYDADDLEVMRGIAAEITNPTYDFFGTLIQFFGSNPSGHPLTVVINSLVNSLYMRYVFYEIARRDNWTTIPDFDTIVALLTYGDDNIMSVKEGFDSYNHTRIASIFSESGITYTMADKDAVSVPFINGASASFLKHYAVWDEDMKLYRAKIEEGSIAKMLHCHVKSSVLNEEQHSTAAIHNVADKYFHYGRAVYDMRREQLHRVARASGIVGLVGEIKTYDEQLLRFREKFDLKHISVGHMEE
jgi:hypothetical protein